MVGAKGEGEEIRRRCLSLCPESVLSSTLSHILTWASDRKRQRYGVAFQSWGCIYRRGFGTDYYHSYEQKRLFLRLHVTCTRTGTCQELHYSRNEKQAAAFPSTHCPEQKAAHIRLRRAGPLRERVGQLAGEPVVDLTQRYLRYGKGNQRCLLYTSPSPRDRG
eukprot:865110-Rhodomonas_salina.3